MKVYESIVATGMAVGVLSGCSTTPEAPPTPLQNVTTEVVKEDINQAYSEARQFWTEHDATIVPSLVMPENESITCGTETVTPAKGKEVIAAACYVTNTMLIWPEPFTEQIRSAVEKGADRETIVELIIHHEYAHFVQKQFNILGHEDFRAKIEPQADCLAGFAMRSLSPNAATSVQIYYEGIEFHLKRPDRKHGSAQARLASFLLGYNPQPGKNCDHVAPLTR